jgi:hypothetical protein
MSFFLLPLHFFYTKVMQKMGLEKVNRDVTQSYCLTFSRHSFSEYEKRVWYVLVAFLQELNKGKKLDRNYQCETSLWGDKKFTIPVRFFLATEQDQNYAQVHKALKSLATDGIEYEDEDVWEFTNFLTNPSHSTKTGTVTFTLPAKMYAAILNFSKGRREYELLIAMSFKSRYAMRFYEMMSGQTSPINYSVEHLREWFCLKDKYLQINDFVKRVIVPAKKELDAKSPYTFTYKPYGSVGKKIDGWTFYPVYQPQFRDPNLERIKLQRQVNISWDLSKEVRNYLMEQYGFTTDEIKRNVDLFKTVAGLMHDFVGWLAGDIKARANRANNPKGYLINALKKEKETLQNQ